MVNKTVAIYVFFDDILKSVNHKEPESRKTTGAEIVTELLSQLFFHTGQAIKNMTCSLFFLPDSRDKK
jgi:hypothetical protein